MAEVRAPESLHLSRRLAVETPEHVVLEFDLAGVGSRAAAVIYDTVILSLLLLLLAAVGTAIGVLGSVLGGWLIAVWIALGMIVVWGYFLLFEALAGGRTPGKRRVGIRVVMDTGHRVTFSAAAIRNLLRVVDAQPGFSYLLGLIFVFFHPRSKRLGDIAAGTIVVRDRPQEFGLAIPVEVEGAPVAAVAPRLSDDEFRLLEGFVHRLDSLDRGLRDRFSADLAGRFAERFPSRDRNPEVFLVQLYGDEVARRQTGTAGRKAGGGAPVSGVARRFVASRQASWERFRARAARIQRRGLRELRGRVLVDFAAAYREVAADLARARTYRVDARIREQLESIVASGHNVLYGTKGTHRPRPVQLLLRDLPAAVISARRYVAMAALLFAVPATVGYFLIVQQPEIAHEVIPDAMISRAELGVEQQIQGRGYAKAPSPYLPIIASAIVANNVQVAFFAFAFGITAGVGTIVILAFNGLFFGSILGLFRNYGLATWLLTFIAGHGPLELAAIFMAGGAGLLLGHAIVAPGDLARLDALLIAGRLALKLVGAAVGLLVLAGVIEGLLSASDAPPALKIGVAAATLLLLALYLEAGRRAARGRTDATEA